MTPRETEPGTTPIPRTRWWALEPAGSLVGLILAVLSVTPSLLPRPAIFQGVLTGVAFGLGYLLGTTLWAILRRLLWRGGNLPRLRRWVWILYATSWVVAIAALSVLTLTWQNEIRQLVRMPRLAATSLFGFLLAFLPVMVILLLIGKATRGMFFGLRDKFGALLSSVLSTLVVAGLLAGFLFAAVAAVDRIYLNRNAHADADVLDPASQFRSAGPGSAVGWDSLGRHGAAFVGGGPSAQDITKLTGQPALEPIRVYAGLKSAPTIQSRADLVVAELIRTGAFDRKVLVVATTTGSGWLEPQAVDALEYLYGGDTAIASMQYAYTPSWVSFVFNPDAPVEAARALFGAVEAKWKQLPADSRPKLISYGLSLGAHGSQAVFADLSDLRNRTAGALFVGSPNSSTLWQTLQAQRDAGSPVWQPILERGREVRWISRPGDETLLPGVWEKPRVLYLQHATDPVTWLSPDLIFQSPEWLEPGQRSSDISPSMVWIPVITALQVTVDMLGGEAVPASFGHNFGDVAVTAWGQVAGESGLDPAAIKRIQTEIQSYAPIPEYDQ